MSYRDRSWHVIYFPTLLCLCFSCSEEFITLKTPIDVTPHLQRAGPQTLQRAAQLNLVLWAKTLAGSWGFPYPPRSYLGMLTRISLAKKYQCGSKALFWNVIKAPAEETMIKKKVLISTTQVLLLPLFKKTPQNHRQFLYINFYFKASDPQNVFHNKWFS